MKKEFNILVVDDNEDFCHNIKDVLELKGYCTQTASDGFTALDIVREKKIDIVLLDIKMPVMDGVKTFKKIKKISPQSQVIMITAFAVEELIGESLENGAFGVLRKPIDFDKLFYLIEKTVSKGSLILVVDDDRSICKNLEDLLNKKGYQVSYAFDGDTAIQQAQESNYDVMLLDLKLPPLNGYEIYTRIRKFRPGLVVILITGYLDQFKDQVKHMLKLNVYACLEKPLNIKQVMQILNEITRGKK